MCVYTTWEKTPPEHDCVYVRMYFLVGFGQKTNSGSFYQETNKNSAQSKYSKGCSVYLVKGTASHITIPR